MKEGDFVVVFVNLKSEMLAIPYNRIYNVRQNEKVISITFESSDYTVFEDKPIIKAETVSIHYDTRGKAAKSFYDFFKACSDGKRVFSFECGF